MAAFSPEILLSTLAGGPEARRYIVGFSGGADSTALLAALQSIRHQLPQVTAVHFNHGVMSAAGDWQAHCESLCRDWNIPLRTVQLDLAAAGPSHFEERARESRYAKLAEWLEDGDVYLTAHHRDDQAETLLLNLARGAGLLGMAGIPRQRRLGAGWVMRPLLDVDREQLLAYLSAEKVAYCRDPSNDDRAYDRNFLRHDILPVLEQRWPGAGRRLARAAGHARNAFDLLAELLESRSAVKLDDPVLLPLDAVGDPAEPFAAMLLRQWLRKHELPGIPEPRLDELMRQLSSAQHAEVRWSGWVIRSYRDHLWLQSDHPVPLCPEASWSESPVLELGSGIGRLQLGAAGTSVAGLHVRPRRPGDRIRLQPGMPSRSIKQLFQDSGTPPWMRGGVPLLCLDDEPVGLGDWMLGSRLVNALEAAGASLSWQPADAGLVAARSLAHRVTVDRKKTLG